MAFIDIKDPKKRDAIVADYLATIQRVRQQNENDKAAGLMKQIELEKTYAPIIEKTAAALQKTPPPPPPLPGRAEKRKRTNRFNAFEHFITSYDKKSLDKYYGIQRNGDGDLMMGDKEVTVDEDSNITVGDKTYNGTTGLWSLIMLATPNGNTYRNDDLSNYADLVQRTDVIQHPRGVFSNSRPIHTTKYRMIKEILSNVKEEEDEEKEEEEEEEEKHGTGIQFLPGDIKGLSAKLNLLLAEYRAGNTSTRNEIVSILDELKRRQRISSKEYRDITDFIALK